MEQSELVSYLKEAKVGELQSLIIRLEDELGVTARSPQVYVEHQHTPEPEFEQTEFDLVLLGFEGKKVDVIKEIRKLTGLGLKESKTMVEETPSVIREGLPKKEAEDAAALLRGAGATVELR